MGDPEAGSRVRVEGEDVRVEGEDVRVEGEDVRVEGEDVRVEGEDVRAQAVRAATAEDRAGAAELMKLMFSIATPAVKKLLLHTADHAAHLTKTKRKKLKRQISCISDIVDQGCMQVKYTDRIDNKPDTVYILLESCPRDHSLSPVLDSIKDRVPTQAGMQQLVEVITMIFNYGRFIYERIAAEHSGVIGDLEIGAGVAPGEFARLKIDMEKTTMYLTENAETRIGINIRRSDTFTPE